MNGYYTTIIKIERIQNERWYKQVLLNIFFILNIVLLFIEFLSTLLIVKNLCNVMVTLMNDDFFMVVIVHQRTKSYKNFLIERLLVLMVKYASSERRSVSKIIFCNIFAGTLYGQGVYFHEHARYSDTFTRLGVANERTMFLASVLIGKTCIGDAFMKVPPTGCDTTSDGQHIFVVYHDAGAYGEYLITYK